MTVGVLTSVGLLLRLVLQVRCGRGYRSPSNTETILLNPAPLYLHLKKTKQYRDREYVHLGVICHIYAWTYRAQPMYLT